MSEHKITVDIYAHWDGKPPRYRIYVNSDLLTERDFIWSGTDQYIRENILVNLEPGLHSLKVEQVSNSGTIEIKNITFNGAPSLNYFEVTE